MVDCDANFLGAIIKKHDRDNAVVGVLSVSTESATKQGDNYASVIERAVLKVVLGSGAVTRKRVILKKALTDIPQDILEDLTGAFNLEGIVYEKFLARYSDLMRGRELPYGPFWADCLFASKNLIVFEDLRTTGFTLGKRQTGLDLRHAKLVFTNLARLHSLSLVGISDGSLFTKILPPYLMTYMGAGEKFFGVSLNALADVIRDLWDPSWSGVEKKIRTMIDDIVPTLKKLYREPHKLSVVCHGDCWVNNMMFKYDANGEPVELKFVDFQLGHCNSYAWDLTYFLHSSMRPEVMLSSFDELIEHYSREFAANLVRFGQDPSAAPSVRDIEEEFARLRPFSLIVACSILPITANPSDISISLDDMLNTESTKFRELFENELFEKTIQTMLNHFSDLGSFS